MPRRCSASPELIKGASESLAGRVATLDMSGFGLPEIGAALPRTERAAEAVGAERDAEARARETREKAEREAALAQAQGPQRVRVEPGDVRGRVGAGRHGGGEQEYDQESE